MRPSSTSPSNGAQFSGGAYFAGASLPSRSVFALAIVVQSEDALKQIVFRDEQPESPQALPTTPGGVDASP